MSKRLGYHSYYSLPPGWYEADWNYSPRRRGYRPHPHNWAGRRYNRLGPVAGFWFMNEVDNWRKRGEYFDEYYKKTGKKPKYYNKITRKKIKW